MARSVLRTLRFIVASRDETRRRIFMLCEISHLVTSIERGLGAVHGIYLAASARRATRGVRVLVPLGALGVGLAAGAGLVLALMPTARKKLAEEVSKRFTGVHDAPKPVVHPVS
jgi:hypothetical protein